MTGPVVIHEKTFDVLIEKVKGNFVYGRESNGEPWSMYPCDAAKPTPDMVGKILKVTVRLEVQP